MGMKECTPHSFLPMFTPCTCTRGKVWFCLSTSVIISTKITRSGDLDIWLTRNGKYTISVDIIEKKKKLASLCFELFGKIHEHRKYFILLATSTNTIHHMFSAHAHNLAQYVGKDLQQVCGLCMLLYRWLSHWYCSMRGMCSIFEGAGKSVPYTLAAWM